MIDQIISALKLSLAECKKYEDPAEYVYQLNMVLNRYKTNAFKLLGDKYDFVQDPKELLQIRICGSWRTRPGFNRVSSIVDIMPVMLHVNGFRPIIGSRVNREDTFNKAVRIDDLIDIERIASIKNDHYISLMGSEGYISEEDLIKDTLGWGKSSALSMSFNIDKTADEFIIFTLQLNAIIDQKVVDRFIENQASSIIDDVLEKKRKRKLKASTGLHEGRIPPAKETIEPADSISVEQKNVKNKIPGLFGGPVVSASSIKRPAPYREKYAGKGNPGTSRNRRNLW